MAETFFYVTGTIFFTIWIAILATALIYGIRILQKIVSIEMEIKDTIGEVRNKISSFSIGFSALLALIEKLVDIKRDRDDRKKRQKENQDCQCESDCRDGQSKKPGRPKKSENQ